MLRSFELRVLAELFFLNRFGTQQDNRKDRGGISWPGVVFVLGVLLSLAGSLAALWYFVAWLLS